jgi:phage repressor protein C with HTH and peptisase S24 domain
MELLDRLKILRNYLGLNQTDFAESLGLKQGSYSDLERGRNKALSESVMKLIQINYNVNTEWLATGEGSMLLTDGKIVEDDTRDKGVPYWNLPVSAGKSIVDLVGKSIPDGFIKGLPGADMAENILPVIGTSMEPEILNGAIIGVRKMTRFDTLNTERIYMIITRDDRMIKRIEHDYNDDSILWCVSPNYRKFKIYVEDIIEIHRICFIYQPV